MKIAHKITIIILLFMFIISSFFYSVMPEPMITHFNAAGVADGYSSRFQAMFAVPLMCIVLFILFLAIPLIDPLKKNIEKFQNYYDWFIVLIISFMLYIHGITILANLGLKINILYFLMPAVALVFYAGGILMEKSKPNFFIGFRTPWTIMNAEVWKKTNHAGGIFFKILAIICILLLFFQSEIAFWLFIAVMLFGTIGISIYSYVLFSRISKQKEKKPQHHIKRK